MRLVQRDLRNINRRIGPCSAPTHSRQEPPKGSTTNGKVSYKSLIDFECHIFNRWGQKMTEFTDPASGWDGTYKGKTVPAGVYYYVIRATGADGKEYKLSGDINIVRYKNNGQTASPE